MGTRSALASFTDDSLPPLLAGSAGTHVFTPPSNARRRPDALLRTGIPAMCHMLDRDGLLVVGQHIRWPHPAAAW